MCLMALVSFLVLHTVSSLDPSIPPKQMPCCPVPFHLKENFKQEIDKILKIIKKPVHEATPWINRFVLVENKDKLGNLK